MGHTVVDPVAGAFRSRYNAAALAEMSRDRSARWKANPPPRQVARVGREDQYLSEGILHAQERNRRWEAGDIAAAWHENLILENYYAPVLNTPSYAAPGGLRWPEAQREDARRRVGRSDSAGTYISHADNGFIRTWPKSVFWGGVTLLVLLILAVSTLLDRQERGTSAFA
jgi:hypothetical protein